MWISRDFIHKFSVTFQAQKTSMTNMTLAEGFMGSGWPLESHKFNELKCPRQVFIVREILGDPGNYMHKVCDLNGRGRDQGASVVQKFCNNNKSRDKC